MQDERVGQVGCNEQLERVMLSEKWGKITALPSYSTALLNTPLSCLPRPPPLLPIASLPAFCQPLTHCPPHLPAYPLSPKITLDRKSLEASSQAEGADALSLKASPGLPRVRRLVLLTLAELLDKQKTAAELLQQFVVAQQGFDLQVSVMARRGEKAKGRGQAAAVVQVRHDKQAARNGMVALLHGMGC